MSSNHSSIDLTQEGKELRAAYETLKIEFSELFTLKNKMLSHDKPLLTSLYLELIGRKLYEVYCLSVELSKLKQELKLLQAYINRNEAPDLKEVEKKIETQFAEYQRKIEEEAKSLAAARDFLTKGKFLTEEESKELKALYYTIVKKLHPDINPEVTEEQKELFIKALAAYELLDLNTLRLIMISIEVGKSDSIKGHNMEEMVRKLSENVVNLSDQIEILKMEFPFIFQEKLEDEEWVKSEQKAANEEIEMLKSEIEKHKKYVTLLKEWKPELLS